MPDDAVSIVFLGLLTAIAAILKLAGAITWPWLWVMSPLWIGAIIFVVAYVFYLFIKDK